MKIKIAITISASILGMALSLPAQANEKNIEQKMMRSLIDNVILFDVKRAQTSISALKTAITELPSKQRNVDIDKAFSDIVSSWKAVQAIYIAGEINSDMIDTPRLMDTYHEGNENLSKQIARALKSGEEPRIALFKNTFKSINALSIVLYTDDTLTQSEKSYAHYILTTLNSYLSDIKALYASSNKVFEQDSDKLMSYILNALIDSSFKLKEWRIGEAAGLAKKYQNSPDNRRQEYPLSDNSFIAAKAIIDTHDAVMGKKDYENLGSIAVKQGANTEVTAIRTLINDAKQQLSILASEKSVDFSDARIKKLYETLSNLNDAYYQSLVKALPVQAKILDADGD
ncbi:MAG: imelysin [Gammaproteobacteria bacterium]|nr:imelysin [Gammaproteobacteria bacterium]